MIFSPLSRVRRCLYRRTYIYIHIERELKSFARKNLSLLFFFSNLGAPSPSLGWPLSGADWMSFSLLLAQKQNTITGSSWVFCFCFRPSFFFGKAQKERKKKKNGKKMIEKTSRRLVNIWAIIDLPTGKKMKISGCSPKTARRAVIKSALRVEHERESEWKDEGKKRMMIKTGAKKEERNNIHRRVPRSSLSLSLFLLFFIFKKERLRGWSTS